MSFKSIWGTVGICLSLFSIASHAATVNYDELIDGDLDGSQSLLFDAGVNTVSGHIIELRGTATVSETDQFDFNIPAGMELVAVSVAFGNLITTPYTVLLDWRNQIWDSATLIAQQDIVLYDAFPPSDAEVSPVDLFVSELPLVSGAYSFDSFASSVGGYNNTQFGGEWDYTLAFEVIAVPAPAAVWLFGSGLIGLIGVGRKKKSQ
jgi:hypothetical protein